MMVKISICIGVRVYSQSYSVHFVPKPAWQLLEWQAAILICVVLTLILLFTLYFSGWVVWCWLEWSCTRWKLRWCHSNWSSWHQKPTGTSSVLITHKLNQPPAQQWWIWHRHLPGDTDIYSRSGNKHLKVYTQQEQIIGMKSVITFIIKYPKMHRCKNL